MGEILKKTPIDNAVTEYDVQEEVINGTYRATEEDYIPYEETPYVHSRNDSRTPSLRERLAAEGYDYLLDEPYEGDTEGDREQGSGNRQNRVKLSDRDDDSVSNRSLLVNAFEGLTQNDIEKQKLAEYRENITLLDAQEEKLSQLNTQIKELSFSPGKRDVAKIRQLRDEATKTANRISICDKQLLRLEASKPLQNVLAREKKKAYQRAEQRGKEALADYKAKVEAIFRHQNAQKTAIWQ